MVLVITVMWFDTHTHPFYGRLSGTVQVGWSWKDKTNLDFTESRDSEWRWHHLGDIQAFSCCRQITMPTLHHSIFYWLDDLAAAQPITSKH